MRAIDADALQLAIVEEGQANKRKKYIIGDIWELTGEEIREVINSQPTIQPDNNSENPNGSDVISRQAAIDALRDYLLEKRCPDDGTLTCRLIENEVINKLPPIQPKRGRWIKLDMHRGMADHKCTACRQECYVPTCMGEPLYAFCPNCGSRNEVTT